MRKKNKIVAAILGVLLGPFGSIYFGWAVFFETVITWLIVTLIIRIPWMWGVWPVFYAFMNYSIAAFYNEKADNGEHLV